MRNEKVKTLAEFLEVKEEEIQIYDENLFEAGNQEYSVLTEEEKEKALRKKLLKAYGHSIQILF